VLFQVASLRGLCSFFWRWCPHRMVLDLVTHCRVFSLLPRALWCTEVQYFYFWTTLADVCWLGIFCSLLNFRMGICYLIILIPISLRVVLSIILTFYFYLFSCHFSILVTANHKKLWLCKTNVLYFVCYFVWSIDVYLHVCAYTIIHVYFTICMLINY